MNWIYIFIYLIGWWCSEYVLNFLHPDHTLPWYAFVFFVFFYLFECYDQTDVTRRLKYKSCRAFSIAARGVFEENTH